MTGKQGMGQQVAAGGARQSLADAAYAAIKQKIITLEFAPGACLSVAAVNEALGIGRSARSIARQAQETA